MEVCFDYRPQTSIVAGKNSISLIGEQVSLIGGKRIFIVTDSGVMNAGHVEKVCDYLKKQNVYYHIFSDVVENPTTQTVAKGVAIAQKHEIDAILGFGGGSSMDCAKGINYILTNGGKMSDYWGYGKAQKPMLPMIAIPTTTGTGSEAQSYALISDSETHKKMACGDPKAAFRIAILDCTVTQTQPRAVIAATGIDAISHAIESAVTKRRNHISKIFSYESWHLLSHNFIKMLDNAKNDSVSAAMQLGASYSGMAIENSMLGATHSCANPLTKNFGITHGHAIAIMLPQLIRFNALHVENVYADLCALQGINTSPQEAGELLAEKIEEMCVAAKLPQKLSSYGITKNDFPKLAQEASQEWTAQFNPRNITADDIICLYEKAL